MATATTKKAAPAVDYVAMLESAPQVAALLPDARYLGVTVFQAPGGWTRIGPTWIMPGGTGWAVFGPGVSRWGTSEGLAQLAYDASPTPVLHAVGLAVAMPNIVYAMTDGGRENKALSPVFEIERALQGSRYIKGGAAE